MEMYNRKNGARSKISSRKSIYPHSNWGLEEIINNDIYL